MPGMRDLILISTLLSAIWTFNDFNMIYILTRGGPAGRTNILITSVYMSAFVFLKFDSAAGQAVVTFVILTIVSLVYARILLPTGSTPDEVAEPRRSSSILLTILLLLFLLFPFFVMLSTMLKTGKDVYTSPPFWFPTGCSGRTSSRSGRSTIWPTTSRQPDHRLRRHGAQHPAYVPAAYAVARLRFVGRKFVLYLFLVIEMFSPVIVVISLFKTMAAVKLPEHLLFLIILANALFTIAFTIWMMNGYFRSSRRTSRRRPSSTGARACRPSRRIMLPIAVPGLVTVMIYAFIFAWNEFLFGLSFISSKNKMPLTIALYNFVGRWTTQWQYLCMAAFLALIPVLVLFYLIEKRLVAGLAGGAVKA